MVFLLLGALTLLAALWLLGVFSRAHVTTLRAFATWVAAIGGVLLAALLFLTGRFAAAVAVLGLLGPLLWTPRRPQGGAGRPGGRSQGASSQRPPPPARNAGMSRDEAYAVLGVPPGADRAAIQAAYLRVMQAAHPDRGGSDWLAARVNQARDVLLG